MGSLSSISAIDPPVTELSNTDRSLARAWHPIARSAEVTDEPSKAWLLGVAYVLVRIAGELVVLEDRCPHRLAPLSAGRVVDGRLECAYHGWQFDSSGRCALVPSLGPDSRIPPKARCGVPYAVVEHYGLVFVAPEQPVVDLPEIPAFEDPDRVRVDLTPFEGPFGAGMLIDNQLDIAHFAYLHRGTFGTEQAAVTPDYVVVREPWGFSVEAEIAIAAANDPGVAAGLRPIDQHRRMHYRYRAPFHVELLLEYPVMGGSSVITFFAQPETAERSRLYVTLLFAQPGGFPAIELAERVAFEYRVIGEDLDLQARFDLRALPLDLGRECHVRADRASVEYRRILGALVRSGGIAPPATAVPAPANGSRERPIGAAATRA